MPETVEDAGLNPVQLMPWTLGLSGDLQTSYEPAGLSGETLRGLAHFTPAIPDEATWLEVFVRSGVVRFEL